MQNTKHKNKCKNDSGECSPITQIDKLHDSPPREFLTHVP